MKTIRIAVIGMAVLLGIGLSSAAGQTGAIIWVTSLEDKISSTGGCSLREAIFSANFDNSIAIHDYIQDEQTLAATPHFITTQCVPGAPPARTSLSRPQEWCCR